MQTAKTLIRLGHWADAQADLNLRWAHSDFVGFVMSRRKMYLEKGSSRLGEQLWSRHDTCTLPQ